AFPVGGLRVEVEVAGCLIAGGGHDVPAGSAAADVVERGESAGQVVWLVVRRRRGRDQANVAGRAGNRGEQDRRLEGAARSPADRIQQDRAVGEEDRVELAPFRDLG